MNKSITILAILIIVLKAGCAVIVSSVSIGHGSYWWIMVHFNPIDKMRTGAFVQ